MEQLFPVVLTMCLALICMITDAIWKKLYNWVLAGYVFIGLIHNVFTLPIDQNISHLLQGGIVMIIGLPIFLAKAIGGGDAKYIAVLVTILGYTIVEPILMYSILLAGLYAIILLAYRRELIQFFVKVFRAIYTLVIPGLVFQRPGFKSENRIPLGVFISLSTIWVMVNGIM